MERRYILNAIDAALQAGEKILSIYDDPASDFQVEKKADNSPLTIADRKAHETICRFLADTPFPLLRNIALVHHSVPVMGVIYVPVKKELYFGVHDSGAYKLSGITARDGMSWDELLVKAVRLPETSVHERFVIVASRSHLTPETEDYIEKMKCSHAEVELISSGSSIKICLVAEGKADVYPRFAPTMEWDTAAGHAIARAAGMEIYQAGKEEPLQYNKEDLLNPWFIVEAKRER